MKEKLDVKTAALDVLKESVSIKLDIDGALISMMDKVLEPVLKDIVADTENTFDDMIVVSLLPLIKDKLVELAEAAEDKLEEKIESKLGDIIE